MEAGMVRFLGRDIHFPRGYGPRRDSSCWFTPGVICSGGKKHTHTKTHTQIYCTFTHGLVYCSDLNIDQRHIPVCALHK